MRNKVTEKERVGIGGKSKRQIQWKRDKERERARERNMQGRIE